MTDTPPMQSDDPETLKAHIMDPRVAKTAAELWAAREIEKLHERLAGTSIVDFLAEGLCLTKQQMAYLWRMKQTGLYGATLNEVVISLVLTGIREAVVGGFIEATKVVGDA